MIFQRRLIDGTRKTNPNVDPEDVQNHLDAQIQVALNEAKRQFSLSVEFSNLAILQAKRTHTVLSTEELDTHLPTYKAEIKPPASLPFFGCLSDYLLALESLEKVQSLKNDISALTTEGNDLDHVCYIPEVAAQVPKKLDEKISETEEGLKKFKQTAKKQLLLRIATLALGVLTFASIPIPPLLVISGLGLAILGIVSFRSRHVNLDQLKPFDPKDFELRQQKEKEVE